MHKKTISKFIGWVKQNPLSTEQSTELKQRVKPLTTAKELSNAIIEWCEKYPLINQSFNLSTIEGEKGAGAIISPPSPPSLEEDQRLKEELINVMNTHSSPNNPPKQDNNK